MHEPHSLSCQSSKRSPFWLSLSCWQRWPTCWWRYILTPRRLFQYAMKIRTPKLIVMLITAFAIGGASLVFQSIINNTIVTPCLLGMNSLYTLIHTAVVFCAGSASVLASNRQPLLCSGPAADGRGGDGDLQLPVSKDQPQRPVCAADRNGAFLLFLQYPDHHDPHHGPERVRRPVEHPGGQLQQHQF